MKGLRSSNPQGEASDNLGRLSLNKRSQQIIGGDTAADAADKGGSAALGNGARGTAKAAGKVGGSVVSATAVAASTAKQADSDEDVLDATTREAESAAVAATQKGAGRGAAAAAKGAGRGASAAAQNGVKSVRSGSNLAGKAVKGGIMSAQKRATAAKAAKSAASTGTSITRAAATQARVAAAAANALRAIVAAVTTVVTSTPVITIVSAVLAVVLLIIALLAFFAPASAAACTPTTGGKIDPTKVPQTAIAGFGPEQLLNAAYVVQAAQDMGLSARDQTIGIMVAIGESSLVNIDYGDWETGGVTNPDGSATSSIGLFQQQDWWGTREERLDPYIASTKFFQAMIAAVPDPERQALAPTLVGHETQDNADPYHYEKYWETATLIYSGLSGIDTGSLSGNGICPDAPGLPGTIGLDGWASPGSGPINGNFGPREIIQTPSGPTNPFHYGMDLEAGGCGGPIWAARDGNVTQVFDVGGGTMTIEIDHGDGLTTRYLHSYPDEIFVTAGQAVKAGEQIALTGSSGYSTGCHLHFEVRLNGEAVDPLPILTAAGLTF